MERIIYEITESDRKRSTEYASDEAFDLHHTEVMQSMEGKKWQHKKSAGANLLRGHIEYRRGRGQGMLDRLTGWEYDDTLADPGDKGASARAYRMGYHDGYHEYYCNRDIIRTNPNFDRLPVDRETLIQQAQQEVNRLHEEGQALEMGTYPVSGNGYHARHDLAKLGCRLDNGRWFAPSADAQAEANRLVAAATPPRYDIEGSTYPIREALKEMGCRWDGERRVWYATDKSTQAKALGLVREQEVSEHRARVAAAEQTRRQEAAEAIQDAGREIRAEQERQSKKREVARNANPDCYQCYNCGVLMPKKSGLAMSGSLGTLCPNCYDRVESEL